ncbi:MAG: hypothetical protein ACTHJ2_10705 [Candidatus Nitrosocosmicus sp.]
MNVEKQVITLEQAIELKRLGVKQKSLFYWRETLNGYALSFADNDLDFITGFIEPDTIIGDDDQQMVYSAFTVSELLKILPFIIRHEQNDYFMTFTHSMKGYRVAYETNKLGLEFNLDGELDRQKLSLFQTMRTGKYACNVLAEYLRMLIAHGDGVVILEQLNQRIENF